MIGRMDKSERNENSRKGSNKRLNERMNEGRKKRKINMYNERKNERKNHLKCTRIYTTCLYVYYKYITGIPFLLFL
jgi:hypothetical protein